jgi:putative endonuclease
MASKRNGTLYTGMTCDLMSRVTQHKEKINKCFTSIYNVNKLVYFEQTDEVEYAIKREKQIKGWLRIKKIRLIEEINPEWKDLSLEWE